MVASPAQTARDISRSSPLNQQVLAHAQSSREVIQEYCPLAESLEWELGQQYFRDRGNKAFISDTIPVPFLINNDGALSRNAAEVFFTSCVEAEKNGELGRPVGSGQEAGGSGSGQTAGGSGNTASPDIFVLEIGIGVGLFARFFLDTFRDICLERKKDYYDRLCYIAADRSERMLHDLLRHGVLAAHPGRYRVRVVDAMEPDKTLLKDAMFNVAISLRETKAASQSGGDESHRPGNRTRESSAQAANPHTEREGYIIMPMT